MSVSAYLNDGIWLIFSTGKQESEAGGGITQGEVPHAPTLIQVGYEYSAKLVRRLTSNLLLWLMIISLTVYGLVEDTVSNMADTFWDKDRNLWRMICFRVTQWGKKRPQLTTVLIWVCWQTFYPGAYLHARC